MPTLPSHFIERIDMYNKVACIEAIKEHMQTWMIPDEIDSNLGIIMHRVSKLKDGESTKLYIGYIVTRDNAQEYEYNYDAQPALNATFFKEGEQKENRYYSTKSTESYTMTLHGTQLPHTISTNEVKLISYAQAVAYVAGMLYALLPSHLSREEKRAHAESIIMDILSDHNKVFQSQNRILFCVEDDLYMAKTLSCFKLLDPYGVVTKHPHILPILCNDLRYCTVLTHKDCFA